MTSEENRNKEIVKQFWTTMASNDFRASAQLLHDEYVLEWPQSGERIRGRVNFAAVNENYPAAGRWSFVVHHLIAEGDTVVTEVTISDGATTGRAITFSTLRENKIVQQTEYWPEPFKPAAWRAQWIEPIAKL